MTDRELKLKIGLARAGLNQDAANAAKTIQAAMQGIEAQVGVDQEKLQAELKAIEAFTRNAFDEIPVGFSVDKQGRLKNDIDGLVDITKRQIEVGLQGLEVDLAIDDESAKRAEQALRELADETVNTARQAKFLREAYNLNPREVEQVIRRMDELEKETEQAAKAGGNLNGAIAGLAGGAAFAALNALQEQLGKVLNLIGSIPGRLSAAADANADYERTLLALDAQLRSAGDGVGFTRDELVQFASDLGEATLTSEEAVLRASRSLLSFRSVTGDTFTRAITVAQDLAEVMGGDLESNIVQLGKALEDPRTGLSALSESGTQFTAEQKELINSLLESGNQLEAQNVILEELERQYGGTAVAAAQGLAGIRDTLGEFVNDATRNLGGALTPAFEGFDTLLMEIVGGLEDVDLGELTSSSERLKQALAGNPETVEQIVEAFTDLAQQGVDGLTRIIDGITALTSNETAVDSFTDGVEDLGAVIKAVSEGTAFVIALAEGFIVLKAQAEGIPIIGGYLSGLLNPIGSLIDRVQALKELGEETLRGLGTDLIRLAGLIDQLPGFEDLAASARSLGADIGGIDDSTATQFEGVGDQWSSDLEEAGQQATDAANKQAEEIGSALNDAASGLSAPEVPPPSPPNLEAISEAYQQLTTELELEQERQRTALLEGGATQQEIAAQEKRFLQERVNAAQAELTKLRGINADALDPDDAAQLQAQITSIEQQSLRDRQALAKAKADATKAGATEEAAAVEDSEADKVEAAEAAAEAQAKAAEDARKREIDAAKIAAAIQEAQLSGTLEREEARLDAADRVAEAYDRQAQLLGSQLSLFDAQASLQSTLFDAREGRLNDIINDEAASDAERRQAARDLVKLTEERTAKEKQQLEQRQALERQQLATQQQAAALADERAIKEEQFALKKLALQRLELENEARIAQLEGDPAAAEIANARLAALDEQVKLQNDIIASRQQDAAINTQSRQSDRRELLANQQQQDVDLATRQADTARGLASQFDEFINVDRLAERLANRTAQGERREAGQASRFLNDPFSRATLPNTPNPDIAGMVTANQIVNQTSTAQSLAPFINPILTKMDRLEAAMLAVAQNPRSISVSSESPYRDLSRVLREISDMEDGGLNP